MLTMKKLKWILKILNVPKTAYSIDFNEFKNDNTNCVHISYIASKDEYEVHQNCGMNGVGNTYHSEDNACWQVLYIISDEMRWTKWDWGKKL